MRRFPGQLCFRTHAWNSKNSSWPLDPKRGVEVLAGFGNFGAYCYYGWLRQVHTYIPPASMYTYMCVLYIYIYFIERTHICMYTLYILYMHISIYIYIYTHVCIVRRYVCVAGPGRAEGSWGARVAGVGRYKMQKYTFRVLLGLTNQVLQHCLIITIRNPTSPNIHSTYYTMQQSSRPLGSSYFNWIVPQFSCVSLGGPWTSTTSVRWFNRSFSSDRFHLPPKTVWVHLTTAPSPP